MDDDDFKQEPIRGLPEIPPEGEVIVWQGRPDWWALAREAMKVHWIAGYFVVLAAWRMLADIDRLPWASAVETGVPLLILGAIACGVLTLVAFIQARATVYTITNRRVAMRIGAALTVTLNIPYRWIGSADLDLRSRGTGTIALQLLGETRLSYLVCWPHVRPWYMARTQPALRCISDAERVARILGEMAQTRLTELADETERTEAVPAE
ncbi:MAG: photosynthetic complex putative assembly protein PuhB [Pseudomonadota bacterium]